jgi:lincosamide nucleotidyltransferase
MLPQEAMIERVRELCHRDERLVSALMYGSFAIGEGDQFSDIEFYLFFAEEASEGLQEEAWVAQIAPLYLYYVNEFGNGTAIFENLVRGEFHFEAASNVGLVDAWESAWFPSLESAVLVDKSGELSRRVSRLIRRQPERDTPERALFLCRSLMNWTLMGANLLQRGEYARAEALLTLVHGHLLQAMRLVEGKSAN